MSTLNTNEEVNNTQAMSNNNNLNESMTVVGIEMQSTLEVNESESVMPGNVLCSEYDPIQNLRPSTSSISESSSGTSMEILDNSGDEGIGDDDPALPLENFRFIELQPKIKVAVADEIQIPTDNEEENESDTLPPLVMDNHIYVEHCEMIKNRSTYEQFEDECELEDEENEAPARVSKYTADKDSFSSTDSDVSFTYESKNQENGLNNQQKFSDNNKDSGCDVKKSSSDEDQPVEIPDDEFCEKIVEQVEFYFSDDSLLKDAFLLKHVRRNKEGYVSLKLVSSFKRVRALTKDWRVVGIAIKRKSKKIELNDIETKIRRLDPLPLYDETMPSRTVVATNLPCEKLTIEKVSDIFSKCGEIALVRILRPNCSIPADVRQFVNKHPELQQNECALVEFTESASARRAQKMDGIIVFELVLPKKKTGKKATSMTKMIENIKYGSESENERSRGGENIANNSNIINNNRFFLKRNNSGSHFVRAEHQCSPSPRKMSLGNESGMNVYAAPFTSFSQQQQQQYYEIPARRSINASSPIQIMSERKFSNCSDGYSSCSEALSRKQSLCSSDLQRRLSNASEMHGSPHSRRGSLNCVEVCSCGGSRRISTFSNDSFRRMSNSSITDFPRRISNASSSFSDRKFSNASSISDNRRFSFDRKNSMNLERKYSSGFDPMRKLSQTSDYYINGRKVSTDSGYDRRLSINSITYDNENPIMRSRNNSLVCQNQLINEPLVRKPIGPDPDSKGFAVRTRKFGLVGSPNIN